MRATIDTYAAPNKTLSELHQRRAASGLDPLKDFAEAARGELSSLDRR